MKKNFNFWAVLALFLGTGYTIYAQEEESAEVYLEEYTDEFQETFFEAVKQKSIQNYDKAINLFLECKQLDVSSDVIDYQLAKTYFLDKQYIQAQEYAIATLMAKSEDFWYLENLVNIIEAQGSSIESLKGRLPLENSKLKENLALIYFKQAKYGKAQKVLKEMGNSKFANELGLKIKDSLNKKNKDSTAKPVKEDTPQEDDPVSQNVAKMEELLGTSDYGALEKVAEEALEAYPLQAYFHYAYGAALNGKSDTAKAIEVLEGALDFLFDDDALANKIYKELSKAYTKIGNSSKATEYLNKIKPGL
ncbi:tetratricopeptide repeat protein [Flagellimonas flava]|uniref:tetratricopeptide repeat protein n=1 Tax=Flagellimonas flava TaxID=570519 RepID=UPI003D6613D4